MSDLILVLCCLTRYFLITFEISSLTFGLFKNWLSDNVIFEGFPTFLVTDF